MALLRGCRKILEAGAVLAGGHSIEDEEPSLAWQLLGWFIPKKSGGITERRSAMH